MANILCVDDDPAAIAVLRHALEEGGHRPTGVHNVDAALNLLRQRTFDLIVSDYRMPGTTGLEFLARLEAEGIGIPLVMATGYASIEHAVASIKAGAIDYINKPIRPAQLNLVVDQALALADMRRENADLKSEVSRLRRDRQPIGDTPAFQRVLTTLRTVADARATVLLQGESGTGKEVLARYLHEISDRRERAFVSVNCAALPEHLVESMLFGHEKGAFTGALKQVKGAFERADRGTLLLDEITEMRLDLQAKLLRVLQEQEFERVGGHSAIQVDVRVVATTNRDLRAAVDAGEFREDLFYRLSVVPVLVPPLRQRRPDIPLLVHHFALRAARDARRSLQGVDPAALAMLEAQEWPGNVRELSHAVERAVLLSASDTLRVEDFERARFGLMPAADGEGASAATPAGGAAPGAGDPDAVVLHTLDLGEAEKVLIERALEVSEGNRTRAADLLGINVRTLRNKLNRPSD